MQRALADDFGWGDLRFLVLYRRAHAATDIVSLLRIRNPEGSLPPLACPKALIRESVILLCCA